MTQFKKIVFLLIVVSVFSINAGKSKGKKQPPIPPNNEDSFSEQDHFPGGEHSSKYDHDAFLGEDQAAEFDELTPKQTKQRLRELFPKIDVDQDQKISLKELVEWIDVNMKKHTRKSSESRMEQMDKNKDGKVSWEEYVNVEYDPKNEKGMSNENKDHLKEMKKRDEKRWKHADMDNDNLLTIDELQMFIHPEETPRMTSVLVQENMEMLDSDKDGKISFAEYAGLDGTGEDNQDSLKSLKDDFNNDLDKDKDGSLNKEELKSWIFPSGSPSSGEAEHLMTEVDKNKDNFLTVDEIMERYELFAGSRATNYGNMLKKEL
ncbi:calumenin [Nematostella vectensis]|uniref:calumenin n=1 Tax=Nematostella vectensis TaxID=45351 RepID=UPI00138FB74F|nr:calumenin [Nematostella vectensis]